MVTQTLAPQSASHPPTPGNASDIQAVSVPEAARRIGVGHSTAKMLYKTGELRSFTVGRRRLVTCDAIAEYIARREAEAEK
uniref:Helix-turn-helix domain-containing protein n=1 Tax=mine drainage metagenome TaxID=410659 RepID=E6PBZ9_9ZZZZ